MSSCTRQGCLGCGDCLTDDTACDIISCMIERGICRGSLPGAAISVVRCDDILMKRAFGMKDPNGGCVDTQTVFQIGPTTMGFLGIWFAKLASDQIQCYHERIFRLGDPRFLGPQVAFNGSVANAMSHEIQPNKQRSYMQTVMEHRPYSQIYLENVIKWGATDPVTAPDNEWGFTFEAWRNQYFVPNVVAELTGDRLSIDTLMSQEDLWTTIGLNNTKYGKAAFLANLNKALPLTRECGTWENKYVYDGRNMTFSAGLSSNIDDMTTFTRFITNGGTIPNCCPSGEISTANCECPDVPDLIDPEDSCKLIKAGAIQEMFSGRSRDNLPPDSEEAVCIFEHMLEKKIVTGDHEPNVIFSRYCPGGGDWFNAIGWKQRIYKGGDFRYAHGFLETGNSCLIFLSLRQRFGMAMLTNSVNPFPEAIAMMAYYLFVCRNRTQAFTEFYESLRRVQAYINVRGVKNNIAPLPPANTEIDPRGRWFNNYGGELLVFPDVNGSFLFKWRDYQAVAGQHMYNNFWQFRYTDNNLIPRWFTVNFAFDATGDPVNAHGSTFDGEFDMKKVPIENNCPDYMDRCTTPAKFFRSFKCHPCWNGSNSITQATCQPVCETQSSGGCSSCNGGGCNSCSGSGPREGGSGSGSGCRKPDPRRSLRRFKEENHIREDDFIHSNNNGKDEFRDHDRPDLPRQRDRYGVREPAIPNHVPASPLLENAPTCNGMDHCCFYKCCCYGRSCMLKGRGVQSPPFRSTTQPFRNNEFNRSDITSGDIRSLVREAIQEEYVPNAGGPLQTPPPINVIIPNRDLQSAIRKDKSQYRSVRRPRDNAVNVNISNGNSYDGSSSNNNNVNGNSLSQILQVAKRERVKSNRRNNNK